jgi:hypothetical protein
VLVCPGKRPCAPDCLAFKIAGDSLFAFLMVVVAPGFFGDFDFEVGGGGEAEESFKERERESVVCGMLFVRVLNGKNNNGNPVYRILYSSPIFQPNKTERFKHHPRTSYSSSLPLADPTFRSPDHLPQRHRRLNPEGPARNGSYFWT